MIENTSDFISIIALISIPVILLGFWIYKKLGHRKERILTTNEKYYREW